MPRKGIRGRCGLGMGGRPSAAERAAPGMRGGSGSPEPFLAAFWTQASGGFWEKYNQRHPPQQRKRTNRFLREVRWENHSVVEGGGEDAG